MFDKPFNINEKSNLSDVLTDKDILIFQDRLAKLNKNDFPLQHDFDCVEQYLDVNELNSLKLVKLLYCLDFNKELFLNLGIIVESRLIYIAKLYINNNWDSPINDPNININKELNIFISKSTLGDKSQLIRTLNLFNNQTTSDLISSRLYIVVSLRNFGGHFKINEFLERFVSDPYTRDREIADALYLIKLVYDATNELINNPPI